MGKVVGTGGVEQGREKESISRRRKREKGRAEEALRQTDAQIIRQLVNDLQSMKDSDLCLKL